MAHHPRPRDLLLAHALRLDLQQSLGSQQHQGSQPQPRLALVGAGGKTSALFRLARELLAKKGPAGGRAAGGAETVLVSASTHMGRNQLKGGDHHFIVESPADVAAFGRSLPPGVVVFTGPPAAEERMAGLTERALDSLLALAAERNLALLLEADGSRQRPLKAPAAHEPPIPPWVDGVVVVAGLSGLGRPLGPEWVHRPERFADLAGLPSGTPVTPDALARVLLSPAGGRKNIPPGARASVLLNQAGRPEQEALSRRLAGLLLPAYASIIVANLQRVEDIPPDAAGDSSGHAQRNAGPVIAVHERVAGVVLAAGASERLGRPKQLLVWQGEPLVRRVARTALTAGLDPVVVVTGAYSQEVAVALDGLAVEIVINPAWEEGQSTSLAAGVRALPPETGAVLFLLADQPQVPPPLIRSLVELHAGSLAPLVAPEADGRRANPVLFDRQTFPELLQVSGDQGGRALFARYPILRLPWHDPNLLLDVDTEADWERLQALDGEATGPGNEASAPEWRSHSEQETG